MTYNDTTTLATVVVGSHLHGLATENSDVDKVTIFAHSPRHLLEGSFYPEKDSWVEAGPDDHTYWEIEHFLKIAGKCSPNALEVLAATPVDTSDLWENVRYSWMSFIGWDKAHPAFSGLSTNLLAKAGYLWDVMKEENFKNEDNRKRYGKYARHALRVAEMWDTLNMRGDLDATVLDPSLCRRVTDPLKFEYDDLASYVRYLFETPNQGFIPSTARWHEKTSASILARARKDALHESF